MKPFKISMLALATAFTATTATAESHMGNAFCENAFFAADQDEDDMISQEEMETARDTVFEQLDANADGSIDREEYVACTSQSADSGGTRRDIADWSELDTDDSGWVEPAEFFDQARILHEAARGGESAMYPEASTFLPEDTGMTPELMQDIGAEEYFAQVGRKYQGVDADADRRISEEEWTMQTSDEVGDPDRLLVAFDTYDMDGDGTVTLEEFNAALDDRFARAVDSATGDGFIDDSKGVPAQYWYQEAM